MQELAQPMYQVLEPFRVLNLLKIARAIHEGEFPQEEFDMGSYTSAPDPDRPVVTYDVIKEKFGCGTSCCLAGAAPIILKSKQHLSCVGSTKSAGNFYAKFAIENLISVGICWDFLFDPGWDNDIINAKLRVMYMLLNSYGAINNWYLSRRLSTIKTGYLSYPIGWEQFKELYEDKTMYDLIDHYSIIER